MTGGAALSNILNKHRAHNDLGDTVEHWRATAVPSSPPVRRRLYLPLWFPAAGAVVLATCSLFV